MRDIIISTIQWVVLSSLFIAAGLRLLLAKKPFLVEHRWWVIICLTPVAVNAAFNAAPLTFRLTYMEMEQSGLSALLVICGIAMPICVGIAWWLSRGGNVIGVSETTLRDALRQAFSKQGLSYEESAKGFRLPALNNELIAKTFADGMFSIHLKKFGGRRVFRQLAPEIKEFIRTAPVRINKRAGYALVVIGVAFLLFESLLTYKQLSLRAKMREYTQFSKPSEK